MSTVLDELQSRLERHFGALAEARAERKLPVFALEHGLSGDELAAMTGELKTKLSSPAAYQLRKHWLVWIVYATEQGYDYDGDEYWHTFERRMPRWDRAWRPALRSWFGKFQEKYRGLRPVGVWANFFSIIAWPITHSLLPKDLQGQLARTLYSLRYNLVSRLDRPPAEIGRYIASMSYGGSSRYENFLQQEELVGHIVLALLEHRPADGDAAIHPGTLERLVQDLEKARAAKAWLRDTRQAVESAKFRGAGRPSLFSAREQSRREESTETRPVIRPSLLLRRTNPDEWTPILEIPSFQQVAALSPQLGEFLSRTRCEVVGSPGFRPPGWLLSGAQRRVISTWPDPRKPVVSFQVPDATMQHLLASECCIRPGPSWLFRVGSDGQALEIASRLVRPGRSYVLVDAGNPQESAMASAVAIKCQGVTARQIDIPASLTQAQIDELRALGLSIGETIRIWPAGLSARGWDGEGTTEWLEGESPCFGIDHDKGRGGVGKTVILLQMAYRAYDQSGQRSLVLTFNKALVADMRRTMALLGVPQGVDSGGVSIETVHGFIGKLMLKLGVINDYDDFLERYDDNKALLLDYLHTEAVSEDDLADLMMAHSTDFDWDLVFVDEGQDWPSDEIAILKAVYGAQRLVVSDGVDQYVRGSVANWDRDERRGHAMTRRLRKCLRMKANIASFVADVAVELGLDDWDLQPNPEAAGGRVIVLDGDLASEPHRVAELIQEAAELGNFPVDLLACVPPDGVIQTNSGPMCRAAVAYAGTGGKVWDGTQREARESYPTDRDQLRFVQYDSCRGLEGWTVINFDLDELWRYKEAQWFSEERAFDPLIQSAQEAASRHAARWIMIPLTRAIDTLVISLRPGESRLRSALSNVANRRPDVVEWVELWREAA